MINEAKALIVSPVVGVLCLSTALKAPIKEAKVIATKKVKAPPRNPAICG